MLIACVFRRWCTCGTFSCNAIRTDQILVSALRSVPIVCDCKWASPGHRIQISRPRRCVYSPHRASSSIPEVSTENLLRAGEFVPEKEVDEKSNKYSQLLRLKSVHLLTLFLVLYVGTEVTIGGEINISSSSFVAERFDGERLDCVNYGVRTGRWCISWLYSIGILWRSVLVSI